MTDQIDFREFNSRKNSHANSEVNKFKKSTRIIRDDTRSESELKKVGLAHSQVQASIYSEDVLVEMDARKQTDQKSEKRRTICRVVQVMLLIISIPLQVALSFWL